MVAHSGRLLLGLRNLKRRYLIPPMCRNSLDSCDFTVRKSHGESHLQRQTDVHRMGHRGVVVTSFQNSPCLTPFLHLLCVCPGLLCTRHNRLRGPRVNKTVFRLTELKRDAVQVTPGAYKKHIRNSLCDHSSNCQGCCFMISCRWNFEGWIEVSWPGRGNPGSYSGNEYLNGFRVSGKESLRRSG